MFEHLIQLANSTHLDMNYEIFQAQRYSAWFRHHRLADAPSMAGRTDLGNNFPAWDSKDGKLDGV